MGFLRTDYSNTGDFVALPAGFYECIVSEVKIKETSTGKPMLNCTLTIRDDVEQKGQKRKLFDNIVEQENMMWKFNQVAKAAELPEGEEVETLADFANAIQYKPVRVKVKIEKYNGEDQNRIELWERPQFEGGGGDPFAGGVTIGSEDLPF